jgi:hypothetical protein
MEQLLKLVVYLAPKRRHARLSVSFFFSLEFNKKIELLTLIIFSIFARTAGIGQIFLFFGGA